MVSELQEIISTKHLETAKHSEKVSLNLKLHTHTYIYTHANIYTQLHSILEKDTITVLTTKKKLGFSLKINYRTIYEYKIQGTRHLCLRITDIVPPK